MVYLDIKSNVTSRVMGGRTIWHRTIGTRTIWHQDNLALDNLAPGQFGTNIIKTDNLAPDNLAPGQFGTNIIKQTIWYQEKNDIQIIV